LEKKPKTTDMPLKSYAGTQSKYYKLYLEKQENGWRFYNDDANVDFVRPLKDGA
jgi:hypothetical protein